MKKLIVKTTLATLLTILSLFLIVVGTLSLTMPHVMEKLAGNLGLKQTEASYALQVYKKDKKIESLSIAVQKNYNAKLYNNSATYGLLLIEDENFDSYCQTQSNIANTSYSTKVYLQAITAESYFYINDKEKALQIAQSSGDIQVVDWLLQLPNIKEDTDFKSQLEGLKQPTNTQMEKKKEG